MSQKLSKLINLIGKTGDRLIVYDPSEAVEPYVIMDLASYQKLLDKDSIDLTERDLSDTINRDVKNWQDLNDLNENKPIFEESDPFAEAVEETPLEDSAGALEETAFETLLESVLVEPELAEIEPSAAVKPPKALGSFADVGSILENRAKNLSSGQWKPGAGVRQFVAGQQNQ